MSTLEILKMNLFSPVTLAFALGMLAKCIRSELSLPKEVYMGISIYLLFALGLKGGVELSHTTLAAIALPATATIVLGCITPLTTYFVLRRIGRFSISDSAGIAAHYGSVSAVTFIAAQQFVQGAGSPAEGFMATLLTLLESPGIHIALALGAIMTARELAKSPNSSGAARSTSEVLHEVLTARTMILLVGGLILGLLMGEKSYEPVKPFFEGNFKGVLTIFLLEMGILAGARLPDLRKVGWFLLAFGIAMPLVHGFLGVVLGRLAGLSPGGCTVLAAMAASASYIAAPPAVRVTLPAANPTYYLTASLAITFPFNILAGIPIYYQIARWFCGS